MAILTVRSPCTITIISRGAPLVLISVGVHGGCCNIFGIWNKGFLSNPSQKLVCVFLRWVPTREIYLWPEVFLYMALLVIFVTSHICLDRWPSSRSTTISTKEALELNLIQSLVDQLINFHSACLCKWRLVLRLLISGSWFPPILIYKIAVFTRSLVNKVIMVDELLWWYEIHVTNKKFLDKLYNLLVLLNFPKT